MTILLSSRDKPKSGGSGTSTPTPADEMRQKQKEIAAAKALKREAAENRVREKELAKKQKEEDWKRRHEETGPRGDGIAHSVPQTQTQGNAGDQPESGMKDLNLHSTST